MMNTVKKWVPTTYDAFIDYRVGGMELSAKGKEIIKKMIEGKNAIMKVLVFLKEWNELRILWIQSKLSLIFLSISIKILEISCSFFSKTIVLPTSAEILRSL